MGNIPQNNKIVRIVGIALFYQAMQQFLKVLLCFAIIAPAASLIGETDGNIIGYDGKEDHYDHPKHAGEAHEVYDPVLHQWRTIQPRVNSKVRLHEQEPEEEKKEEKSEEAEAKPKEEKKEKKKEEKTEEKKEEKQE